MTEINKNLYVFDSTTAAVDLNWTQIQQGKKLNDDDGVNLNAGLRIDEELLRVQADNGWLGAALHANIGVIGGEQTTTDNPSGIAEEGFTDPSGNTASSYVSTSTTSPSTRLTFGFDLGPDFRVGRFNINPYIGYKHGQYLSPESAYPIGDLAGSTPITAENYFVVGARAGVDITDHIGIVAGVEHGFGSTNGSPLESDGGKSTYGASVDSGTTSITLGARFTISNPEPVTPLPSTREQAQLWAQGQEDEINTKYKDALKANGYDRVEITVYPASHFPSDTTTPGVPDVSGWYYTIEPIYTVGTGDDAKEYSNGAFDSDAVAADGGVRHTFSTVAELTAELAKYKAPVATATDAAATDATVAPVGTTE